MNESRKARNVEANRRWRERNREKYNRSQAEYRGRPEVRARRKVEAKKRSISVKQKFLDLYGGCCACCGEAGFEFLSLDHVGGGGHAHRQQLRAGAQMYYWAIQTRREGIQILCFNCNCAKGFYGYCPHGKLQ